LDVSAVLSWSGEADSSEVVINDGDATPVNANDYKVIGLTAETEYTWKVRAVEGELTSEWVDGPAFTTLPTITTEPEGPEAPTNLAYSELDHDSVVLTWDGTTYSYEIEIVGLTETETGTVSVKVVTLQNLIYSTEYTWRIRAIEGDLFSEWVDGPAFTTEPLPNIGTLEFPYCMGLNYSSDYFDEDAGTDTSNFLITFTTFAPDATDRTGWYMSLDFCTTQVSEAQELESLDIPAGTYEISDVVAPNKVVMSDVTRLVESMSNGYFVEPQPTVVGGTVTVAGDHNNYTIVANITLNDGRTATCNFSGPIFVEVPEYIAPLGDFVEGYYFIFSRGDSNNYSLRLQDEFYVASQGTSRLEGYELWLNLYAPGEGTTLPSGTYTVGSSDAWRIDVASGSTFLVEQVTNKQDNIASGTITSAVNGETYTIDINLVTAKGIEVKRTFTGPLMAIDYSAPRP
jgi:hypothetical protein